MINIKKANDNLLKTAVLLLVCILLQVVGYTQQLAYPVVVDLFVVYDGEGNRLNADLYFEAGKNTILPNKGIYKGDTVYLYNILSEKDTDIQLVIETRGVKYVLDSFLRYYANLGRFQIAMQLPVNEVHDCINIFHNHSMDYFETLILPDKNCRGAELKFIIINFIPTDLLAKKEYQRRYLFYYDFVKDKMKAL